jgi:hypothetical protein
MRSWLGTVVALAALANVAAWPGRALAEPPPPAKDGTKENVAAESLFEDARSLVAAGHFAEACPKFAESQRLDPSVATLLNLAHCWEKVGRTATAWAVYRQAASAADASGRKDYLATALRRAEALAPHLPRLTIRVAAPVPGLVVRRDGDPVDSAQWGVAIAVDPGSHVIEAQAPDYKSWSQSVEVTPEAIRSEVAVPPLEALPQSAGGAPTPTPAAGGPSTAAAAPGPSPATPPPSSSAAPQPSATTEPSHAGSTQRVVGLTVAGIGVAGLAVSGVTAIVAKSKYNTSKNDCEPSNADLCSATGVSERNDARSFGDVASVALVVGAAATAAGVILWLTAPSASREGSASLWVTPSLGGASLAGAW